MAQNISGFGLRVQIVAKSTFPAGVTITQWADDADWLDLPSMQIADKAMGGNGDLLVWSKANPIVLNLSNNSVLSSGASQVGYYDPVTAASTNVKDNLDFVNNAIANTSSDQTGEIIQTMNPVIPTGWILYQNYTIGSSASGAVYANANAQDLYEMFWDNYSDVICPVTGGRGASASDDFNANKPLLMPAVDDRAFVNTGSYTPGETFGENEVTLTSNQMPIHSHAPPNSRRWIHVVGGSGTGFATTSGVQENLDSTDTATAGGGLPHENRQPSIAIITRIKL